MLDAQQYELLDFGAGRKLERFGGILLDRPCPAAAGPRGRTWPGGAIRFERKANGGRWYGEQSLPDAWHLSVDGITLHLQLTASGQVGMFPEQSKNWSWIAAKLRSRRPVKILNLFGYTGGSTLVAAKAGAEVVHVDAAKSVVSWARRNAERSGLGAAPIRWIVEDAVRFVDREVKRHNRYDGIILDPPSYGHGPRSEAWKLTRDLVELISQCRQLLSETPMLFLLSCHTPGFGPAELTATVSECLFGSCGAGVRSRDLSLATSDGRKLAAGHAAYWP